MSSHIPPVFQGPNGGLRLNPQAANSLCGNHVYQHPITENQTPNSTQFNASPNNSFELLKQQQRLSLST